MNTNDAIVFVVDDDALVRSSIENLCRSVGLQIEAFASTEEFAFRDKTETPACLIIDVRFPHTEASGLDFQRSLNEAGRTIPTILITGHGDVPMSVRAMKDGAIDFLLKPFREQDLLDAIRTGIERDRLQKKDTAQLSVYRQHLHELTPREHEVMKLVCCGLPNKQVAAKLELSEVTVKVHRAHLMQKMRVKSVVDLVRMCDRLNEPTPKFPEPIPKV